MYLRLFFCRAVISRVVLVGTKNGIAVYCAVGWVADQNATNALRSLLRVFKSWIISRAFAHAHKNFTAIVSSVPHPWQFCCSLSRGGFRGGGGGGGASFLKDSTPCRSKGCLLFTILKYPFWWWKLKIF